MTNETERALPRSAGVLLAILAAAVVWVPVVKPANAAQVRAVTVTITVPAAVGPAIM